MDVEVTDVDESGEDGACHAVSGKYFHLSFGRRWMWAFWPHCRYDGAPYTVIHIGPIHIFFGRFNEWREGLPK